MDINTSYTIGDKVYVIGCPPMECASDGCSDGCSHDDCSGAHELTTRWALLTTPLEEGGYGPCTVTAILVMEPDEDDLPADTETGELPPYEVLYAVREAKGQFFPEELCFAELEEARAVVERLNEDDATYRQ